MERPASPETKKPRVAMVVRYVHPRVIACLNAASMLLDLTVVEVERQPDADLSRSRGSVSFPIRNLRDEGVVLSDVLDASAPEALLVLGWSGPGALQATAWAVSRSVPIVVASNSNQFDYRRRSLTEAVKRIVVSAFTVGWASSNSARDYLLSLGMAKDRVLIGPLNTVDNNHFRHKADDARAQASDRRAALGLPPRFFLSVCRLVEEKNLFRLLQAYKLYHASTRVPWPLVVVGDGPLRSNLEHLAVQLGLDRSIMFVGAVGYDLVPAYYGLASAFILASTKDTWAVVVNEAAACGLPLLVSRQAGCAPHLVAEGVNGHTFDPLDVPEMAALIGRFSAHPDDLPGMGKKSQDLVAGYVPEQYARSLHSAVVHTLKTPRGRTSFRLRAFLSLFAMVR